MIDKKNLTSQIQTEWEDYGIDVKNCKSSTSIIKTLLKQKHPIQFIVTGHGKNVINTSKRDIKRPKQSSKCMFQGLIPTPHIFPKQYSGAHAPYPLSIMDKALQPLDINFQGRDVNHVVPFGPTRPTIG